MDLSITLKNCYGGQTAQEVALLHLLTVHYHPIPSRPVEYREKTRRGGMGLLAKGEFIRISLEINLFFQRIMKEHLFLFETNLQPVEVANIAQARVLKQSFEQLLAETVDYANGVISESAVSSNEFVTPYTLRAEESTSKLSGASLNMGITMAEMQLVGNGNYGHIESLESIVYDLNARSLNLLGEVIAFQKRLLNLVLGCEIFITLYPEMLEHVTREAEYYRQILHSLQGRKLPERTLCEKLNFWNNIMEEHAEFINGMLDPTEETLKQIAEAFAARYEKLIKECIKAAEKQIISRSLEATREISDFKEEATAGLLDCEIKSIISPLLADHVYREANHYLRVLKMLLK